MATYYTPFERTLSSCKSDLRDTGDTLILEVDLPGFAKDEIQLDVTGDILTLKATHKEKTQEEKEQEGTYLRRERTLAAYEQKIDVSEINVEQLQANYENGVLTLTMPKKVSTAPVSRRIDIL